MKTVTEMAQGAGFETMLRKGRICGFDRDGDYTEELERFAELVRADERNWLATKLVQDFKGAFGDDTCASWAVWIRGEKK